MKKWVCRWLWFAISLLFFSRMKMPKQSQQPGATTHVFKTFGLGVVRILFLIFHVCSWRLKRWGQILTDGIWFYGLTYRKLLDPGCSWVLFQWGPALCWGRYFHPASCRKFSISTPSRTYNRQRLIKKYRRKKQEGFDPDEEDCIMARTRTTGMVLSGPQRVDVSFFHFAQLPNSQWLCTRADFHFHRHKYSIIDVGGQRSERRKWIHFFDNVQVSNVWYISCVNLSYDQ